MNRYKIRISAKGFFFNSKDKVLLTRGIRKERKKVYYCAPGGGVERGETLRVALERELIEETGYSGKTGKIIFCQDYKNPDQKRSFEVFFIGKIDESIERIGDGDHQSKFFTEKEFEKIDFYPKGINPFKLRTRDRIEYNTYL